MAMPSNKEAAKAIRVYLKEQRISILFVIPLNKNLKQHSENK